jgi:hypothetical protein
MPDSLASERPFPRPENPGSALSRCVTRAFGLKLALEFDVHGLGPIDDLDPGGATRVYMGEPRKAEAWLDSLSEPIFERRFEDGSVISLHRHPHFGYRLFAEGWGTYEISPSLNEVVCAPNRGLDSWQWQRLLTAQVLPLLAVLSGREVLHASAVVMGDRVIALVGGPGAGKTSLALHLVASGARLFADDVLALELSGDEVIAHPGIGVVNLSPGDRERLSGLIEDEQDSGADAQELRVVVGRATQPLKLAAVYFIDRPDTGTSVSFERLDSSERILGATFNLSIREPDRLRRHLEVCAAIAKLCGQYRISVPGSVPAAELAAAVAAHAAGVS